MQILIGFFKPSWYSLNLLKMDELREIAHLNNRYQDKGKSCCRKMIPWVLTETVLARSKYHSKVEFLS